MSDLPSREQLSSALTQVQQRLTIGLWVTHSSYALFLVILSWLNFQSPENGVKLWLVKMIPLLIFIPGFIQRKYRTYSWLCFAILPYFIWIIPLAIGKNAWSDWVLVALIAIIFNAAMMTSRWFQQESYLGWQISNTPSSAK